MHFSPIGRSGLVLIAGLASAHTPLAWAQSSTDPAASVPAVVYRSVFHDTSLGVEQDKTDWRKANADVGRFTRGHIDILKQEEMESPAHRPQDSSKAPAASGSAHRH